MDFDTDIKPKLTALARHGGTVAAGFLLEHGWITKSSMDEFVSATVAVALLAGVLFWSFVQKELQKQAVQKALATPVLGTFTLDDAATMLAPVIQKAINDALPTPDSTFIPELRPAVVAALASNPIVQTTVQPLTEIEGAPA